MTQKEIIVKYLELIGDWTPAYKLRSIGTPIGWLGHQADRRARELARAGKIDHKIEGKYAYYRPKQKELIQIKLI